MARRETSHVRVWGNVSRYTTKRGKERVPNHQQENIGDLKSCWICVLVYIHGLTEVPQVASVPPYKDTRRISAVCWCYTRGVPANIKRGRKCGRMSHAFGETTEWIYVERKSLDAPINTSSPTPLLSRNGKGGVITWLLTDVDWP